MSKINIAIDGPSGAGKTTIAREIAKRYNFLYLDTGSLYRTIGLFAIRNSVDSKDKNGVLELLPKINIELKYENEDQRVILNGEDVSGKIRTPLVSIYASDVSAIEGVRAFLLGLQQKIAKENDCVLDGRDIGTVVLPNARLKIFLTASISARALRRYNELIARGEDVSYDDVLSDMVYRDQNDSTRSAAPLKSAADAITLDSTELTVTQTIDAVDFIIKERLLDVL